MQHFLAAAFESNLIRHGKDKFADWLVESFCGEKIGPNPGSFHHDEEEFFGKVFAFVFPELSNDAKQIITQGVAIAAPKFEATFCKYENLYNLSEIVALTDPKLALLLVSRVFQNWFDLANDGILRSTAELPNSVVEVFSLQQTLLSIGRNASIDKRLATEDEYESVAKICVNLLFENLGERRLTPCWDAMARIALSSDVNLVSLQDIASLQTRLLTGFALPGQPFIELFDHEYKGLKYSFDYPALMQWITDGRESLALDSIEAPPLYTQHPFVRELEPVPHGSHAETTAIQIAVDIAAEMEDA